MALLTGSYITILEPNLNKKHGKAGEQEIIILLSDALLRTGIGAGSFFITGIRLFEFEGGIYTCALWSAGLNIKKIKTGRNLMC